MWRHHVYLQREIVKRKSFLFKDFIYLFLERREEEREGGKHQCVVASHTSPTGDLAHNPGMCPDQGSNSDPLVCRLALNPLSHTSQECKQKIFIGKINCQGSENRRRQGWDNSHSKSVRILMEKVTLWDFKGHGLCFSTHPHSSFVRTVSLSTILSHYSHRLTEQTLHELTPGFGLSGLC